MLASVARCSISSSVLFFFFQAEDGIRDLYVTGVQTCALPISLIDGTLGQQVAGLTAYTMWNDRVYGEFGAYRYARSEEHTSELQSRRDLVCRLLLEKKNKKISQQEYSQVCQFVFDLF